MSSNNFTADISISDGSAVVERWARVEGDSIPYLSAGNSERRVLLAHGAGASRMDWMDVIPVLASANSVYAPDLIGFGETPRGDFAHTPEYMADFLVEFMDAVGVEEAILVGHSLGGRVCLELARRHPERVSGLVLEAPMGFGKVSWPGRMFSMARWSVHRVLGLRSPYPQLDFPLVESDSTEFDTLTCKTLMLWGAKDLYFPAEQGLIALDLIPNSTLKVYERVGHSVHRSVPARLNSDVTAFLEEIV